MFSFRQTGERSAVGAARQAARAATLCLPALWGYGGGDTTGQGNGGDERDERFVEQHCQGCLGMVLKDLCV